ncbi:glycoside hydrolase family protein [Membranihabitans marinus]|uniref:hypothetical protein n=1 Tax=Membranihabitans marinus TaxID=1227546 RepID=UPI001F3C5200|nr:hypothetical protein [Membranihabitans marinus]
MKNIPWLFIFLLLGCQQKEKETEVPVILFPSELVNVTPLEAEAVFTGTGQVEEWDKEIRERGFILLEDGIYKMWYTGYNKDIDPQMKLGYATSTDGIKWERHPDNPIFEEKWTEDVFVQHQGDTFYMFAEGENDLAHLMTSSDGINWEEKGDLIIEQSDGQKVIPPYGTPTIWIEKDQWYLFYEKTDMGIWLATSKDLIHWTNVQDDPVISLGPETYDVAAVAANQVIHYKGSYYLYYHATSNHDWLTGKSSTPIIWTSNIARSDDLIHWTKYEENPIIEGDYSSPIVIMDHQNPTLFTMHDEVHRFRSGN